MNTQAKTWANISATPADVMSWRGGKGSFIAHATWGGGTVKLQTLGPDGTTWIDAGTDTTLTADGGGNFELPPGQLRPNIATATGVYVTIASTQ